MGCMPPNCFSNAKNQNVENKRDIEGGTWLQAMCSHTLKKRSKPLIESFGIKQFHKSSYIIPKKPSEERCGEQAKVETNASWFKVTFVSRWESSTKGGKSTLVGGWRRQKTLMVSLDGAVCVLGINACIVRTYLPTLTRANS
jgi:hypothetical protein